MSFLVKALNKVDLPTLGRPTIPMDKLIADNINRGGENVLGLYHCPHGVFVMPKLVAAVARQFD